MFHSTAEKMCLIVLLNIVLGWIRFTVGQEGAAAPLCLPNCQCTLFKADCLLAECYYDFHTNVELIVLRGILCPRHLQKLAKHPELKKELHNGYCGTLSNCE